MKNKTKKQVVCICQAGLIAALYAKGDSEIQHADLILRGYENLEQKLRTLGAEIKICE